jgi:hypothetical protein
MWCRAYTVDPICLTSPCVTFIDTPYPCRLDDYLSTYNLDANDTARFFK